MARRFSLSGGMILMLGLGLGLGLIRAFELDRALERLWYARWRPTAGAELALVLGLPLGAGLTPCCALFQTRGRPGYAACLIATLIVVPVVLAIGVAVQIQGLPPKVYLRQLLLPTTVIGAGIFWSWLTLLFMGVWKPEPDWRDRLGRAIGAAWIALGVLCGYFLAHSTW